MRTTRVDDYVGHVSLGLTDHSLVDILGMRYKSANVGEGKNPQRLRQNWE